MKLRFCMLLLLFCSTVAPTWAAPFTDEMSKCLVSSTSDSDKTLLIKWIFAAMSAHPDVKVLSNVTTETGVQLNQDVAKVVMRLLTRSCKNEAMQAVKFEGEDAFKASFEVLGRVAMQGLMNNPGVSDYFSGFEKYLDADLLQQALRDPGQPRPTKK